MESWPHLLLTYHVHHLLHFSTENNVSVVKIQIQSSTCLLCHVLIVQKTLTLFRPFIDVHLATIKTKQHKKMLQKLQSLRKNPKMKMPHKLPTKQKMPHKRYPNHKKIKLNKMWHQTKHKRKISQTKPKHPILQILIFLTKLPTGN